MKPSEILDILVKGEINRARWSQFQKVGVGEIAARLAERGVGSADQFMKVVKDGRSRAHSPAPLGASLEGYLFPEATL